MGSLVFPVPGQPSGPQPFTPQPSPVPDLTPITPPGTPIPDTSAPSSGTNVNSGSPQPASNSGSNPPDSGATPGQMQDNGATPGQPTGNQCKWYDIPCALANLGLYFEEFISNIVSRLVWIVAGLILIYVGLMLFRQSKE